MRKLRKYIRKTANIIKYIYRYGFFTIGKPPYPTSIMIDPTNICNLKCPLCPTGIQKNNSKKEIMPYDTFTKIIDKLLFVKTINLYRLGEPFLNQDVFDMTKYATDRNIDVCISTNFSLIKQDDFFENIVRSGLQLLVVSLDGTTEQTYSQYRKGGDFELVVANMKRMVEVKERLHSENPRIVWQFIVNRYNELEIEEARLICQKLDITLDIKQMGLSDDLPDINFDVSIEERKATWLPANNTFVKNHYKDKYQYPLYSGICQQLFVNLNISSDGKVFPCCWAVDKDSAFGDLVNESFTEIWNNQKYQDARRMFLRSSSRPSLTVCFKCNNFNKEPTFKDKLRLAFAIINGIAQ